MEKIEGFDEFCHYVYINDVKSDEGIRMTIYFKVFSDYEKMNYLGSLKVGVLCDFSNEELDEFIDFILSMNFPYYKAKETEIIKM